MKLVMEGERLMKGGGVEGMALCRFYEKLEE